MDVGFRRGREQSSPDRAKLCMQQERVKINKPVIKKIQVVYYLTRNGQLEHPHYMEVTHFANQPLRLKDVMERLMVLRGKNMPSLYSWSCKRSYKNGYVWNDLAENDIIYPADGAEFVLKGSELLDACPVSVERIQETHVSNKQVIIHDPTNFQSKSKQVSSRRGQATTEITKYEQFYEQEDEPTMYFKFAKGEKLICSLYVDNLMVVCSNEGLLNQFKSLMRSEFSMSDLGQMQFLLGLQIEQTKGGIFIHQRKFAQEILRKYEMNHCNPVATPIEEASRLNDHISHKEVNPLIYKDLIGSLLYLNASRPDVMHVVNYLSCYMEEPSYADFAAVKRILKYIKGTEGYGIMFDRGSSGDLRIFCDANLGGELKGMSRSGYCCSFGSGVFAWSSKKHKIVALSSAEAEYVALHVADIFTKGLPRGRFVFLRDLLGMGNFANLGGDDESGNVDQQNIAMIIKERQEAKRGKLELLNKILSKMFNKLIFDSCVF